MAKKKRQYRLDAVELSELAGIAAYLNSQTNNRAVYIGRVEIWSPDEEQHSVKGFFDMDPYDDHRDFTFKPYKVKDEGKAY